MEQPQKRIIFHIDVNSAFLSWESVYRLKQDPEALDLRTIPSAVGGDQASRHGIVLAKSTPAKTFGIVTGEPLAQALKKCPGLTVVPSRFDVYLDFSERLIHLLEEYTPDIEKFSIDEAFLDMTSTIHLFGEPLSVADKIWEQIRTELGFTVNVGISSNKLLAKMASDFQKPDRCHTLWEEEVPKRCGRFLSGICSLWADPQKRRCMPSGFTLSETWLTASCRLLNSIWGINMLPRFSAMPMESMRNLWQSGNP